MVAVDQIFFDGNYLDNKSVGLPTPALLACLGTSPIYRTMHGASLSAKCVTTVTNTITGHWIWKLESYLRYSRRGPRNVLMPTPTCWWPKHSLLLILRASRWRFGRLLPEQSAIANSCGFFTKLTGDLQPERSWRNCQLRSSKRVSLFVRKKIEAGKEGHDGVSFPYSATVRCWVFFNSALPIA